MSPSHAVPPTLHAWNMPMFLSPKRVKSLAASSRHSAAVSWGEAQQAQSDQGLKPQGGKGRLHA